MAERTPLFEHLLVVQLSSFFPGVSDFLGTFFSDAPLDTDGDVSLQAVNWMLSMTFGIASIFVAFHRSHCDGLNLLSCSFAKHLISGNQL